MFGLFIYRVMTRLRVLRAVAVASSLAAAAMLALGASAARADNDVVYVSSTKN
ncbi:secretin, partial [Mesorhizobium sp. M7A.F.Ca.CA.001.12.2.1]